MRMRTDMGTAALRRFGRTRIIETHFVTLEQDSAIKETGRNPYDSEMSRASESVSGHESRLQHFREQNKRDASRWGEERLDNVAVTSAEVLERLLRAETATERALNRAIARLERLQRRRVGPQPLSPDLGHGDLHVRDDVRVAAFSAA